MVRILHRRVRAGAADVFYRETSPVGCPTDRPPILLLHGFPSSSHQYRSLMETLGEDFRMIAPDLPGFGHTQIIEEAEEVYEYSFECLSRTIDDFVDALELGSFVLYAFDYGGPVGFRVAARRPELIAGLIVQNANAYDVGLSKVARHFALIDKHDASGVKELEGLLTPEGIRFQYATGARNAEAIAPDGYSLDQHFLERPRRRTANIELLLDYRTNLAQYPVWQAWLRQTLPPALIVWGRNDPLFVEAGARAYLADIPHAELQFFDTGHFALEECLGEIAPLIAGFVKRLGPVNRPVEMQPA